MLKLESLIDKLVSLNPNEAGYATSFDEILFDITKLQDSKSIEMLIQLFDDEAEYDELMFSIIHSIEQFDDMTYVNGILNSIEFLYKNSPRWASILIIRIINSELTREAFLVTLLQRNDVTKKVVREMLIAISMKGKELSDKVTPIILEIE